MADLVNMICWGQPRISRVFKLEKHFRFVGVELILQQENSRYLTDVKFRDSSNEMDGSVQF